MKLSEEEKEDITDMVIESRDVEEDLTTVYLKGYADAEEKYRKKIKELEVLEDDLKDKRVVYIDTPEFAENYIPKQKVKDLKESIILEPTIVGGRRNAKTLEYGIKLGKIKACEELLEDK